MQLFAFSQTVADSQLSVVGQADNVARKGVFRQFAFLSQKHDRRGHFQLFARAGLKQRHSAFEMPRANAHKSDSITMFGVHVGLNFENKTADFRLFGAHFAFGRRPRTRGGRHVVQTFQHLAHAEIVDGAAEKDGGQRAGQIKFLVKGRAQFAHHFHVFAQFGDGVRRQQTVEFFVVETAAGFDGGIFLRFVAAFVHQNQLVADKVVTAEKIFAHADRPAGGRHVERQRFFDVVEQAERVEPFAVELVDKGDNRYVAQAADFKQFFGLAFNAFGRVDNHHRGIDGGQHPIGVFGKIFVSGCVEQVKGYALIVESHHRRGHRNAAFLFHFHPVGAGAPGFAAGFDRAGLLDGAAEQKQFFGKRCFTGVRVGNDGESFSRVGVVVHFCCIRLFNIGKSYRHITYFCAFCKRLPPVQKGFFRFRA